MKVIYFNGHKYKWADLDDSRVEATLERNLKIMSPLIIVNEITDAKDLLSNIDIEEEEFQYILTVP